MSQVYRELLGRARSAAEALKAEVEPQILGKRHPGFSCNCGAISQGESVAVRVRYGGEDPRYEYQLTKTYDWSVDMEAVDGSGKSYSITGLGVFLPGDQVNMLF